MKLQVTLAKMRKYSANPLGEEGGWEIRLGIIRTANYRLSHYGKWREYIPERNAELMKRE